METIHTAEQMQQWSDAVRATGQTIAFVPTMGFLHEGHLELVRAGTEHSSKLVVSIFVNPTQFAPNEDFDQYPSDEKGDLKKAHSAGVDIVFKPSVEEMYPDGSETVVRVEKLPMHLCGLSRPGHFDGVTTVVAKLFNIVKPHIAVFGQKDYQQLTVISKMVIDLNMDIRILGVPTYRESDGLAMSSRNSYLSEEERRSALCLKKSLDLACELFRSGEKETAVVKNAVCSLIRSYPFTEIDYVNLCDPVTLDDVHILSENSLLALAVHVGKTRLIDNCVLTTTTE